MFPWKTVIQLNTSVSTPLYLQLANAIVQEITAGRLAKSIKMPGTRAMSELLVINRKTVVQAYDELIAQGWLEVFPSSGTYVSGKLPVIQPQGLKSSLNIADSNNLLQINSPGIIPAYKSRPPHQIEINDGAPDHRLAPVDWLYKECRSLTRSKYGKHFLKYADVHGDEKLRTVLSKYLSETRGMNLEKENILITRGSQMGLYMILNILLNKEDVVIVGDTSYDAADWTIQHHGGTLERVLVDDDGLNIDQLETTLQKKKIKAVYITPHHHFPTSVTLSAERRIRLLELALVHNFAIIEDDYDYDFHYSSSPLLPLASLNHHEHVIYMGSFSKVFAPAIRVGYIVASPRIIDQLSKVRRIIDRQGDPVMENVLAQAIETGELQRHLKKTIKIYESRRNLFCQLLKNKLDDISSFKTPEGGMAIWTTFSKDINISSYFPEINRKGLYLNIDKTFVYERNALRLGFASVDENEIKEAMEILTSVLKSPSS